MKYSAQRDKQVRRVILIEGSANLLVLILKTIVGLSTGSMAILADAIHSLTDLTNNVIAWFVMHFSSLSADREHSYGYRKFEILAVFILASILVVLAFELVLNAIRNKEAHGIPCRAGCSFATVCRARIRSLPEMRSPGAWLPARAMQPLPCRAPGGFQLQMPRVLSQLRGAAHGRECGPVGRRGLARTAHAPMGAELSVSIALSVRQPAGDHDRGAGHRLPRYCNASDS